MTDSVTPGDSVVDPQTGEREPASGGTCCDATRESIAAYLEEVSKVEVGTILAPAERETVEMCAAWVRNGLDLKWWARASAPKKDPPDAA